ncbi:uncharacterized protein LOC129594535 [Paramacrobiotus metropolitanus]|uniref:uncharacterized protein LOC129594535 n=1 Tax=Paramacrobiotus metropolitanus TaxID=2943436 RepID=UPI0024463189|nr:uncharacterized protein LOC129594535 [Paramacrobiotus metropolitanus]
MLPELYRTEHSTSCLSFLVIISALFATTRGNNITSSSLFESVSNSTSTATSNVIKPLEPLLTSNAVILASPPEVTTPASAESSASPSDVSTESTTSPSSHLVHLPVSPPPAVFPDAPQMIDQRQTQFGEGYLPGQKPYQLIAHTREPQPTIDPRQPGGPQNSEEKYHQLFFKTIL